MRFFNRPLASLLALVAWLLLASPALATEVRLDRYNDHHCNNFRDAYTLPHTARMELPGNNGCHNLPSGWTGNSARIAWCAGSFCHCQFHTQLNCQGGYTSIQNVGFNAQAHYEYNCKFNFANQRSVKCYWY